MMKEKYDLVEKVGEGSFGIVYKSYDRVDNKIVFLKYFDYGGTAAVGQKQFSCLKKLEHDNIISLVDVTNDRGEHLVYEYLPLNLKQFMGKHPEMFKDPKNIKSFLHQILSGVAYLHARDIVHKDLNPHNLLIDLSKTILKVADLGLTRKLGFYDHKLATMSYKGPEFILGNRLSAPSDVWAVGCIFAEMVTQKILFPGECEGGVLLEMLRLFDVPNEDTWPGVSELFGRPPQSVLRKDLKVKSLADVVTDLDPPGFDLLSKMLTLNPAARITAKEALDHAYFKDPSHK